MEIPDINTHKIQYQEICSDPDWCIVKIIPINPEPVLYEYGVTLAPTDTIDANKSQDSIDTHDVRDNSVDKSEGKSRNGISGRKPPKTERRAIPIKRQKSESITENERQRSNRIQKLLETIPRVP